MLRPALCLHLLALACGYVSASVVKWRSFDRATRSRDVLHPNVSAPLSLGSTGSMETLHIRNVSTPLYPGSVESAETSPHYSGPDEGSSSKEWTSVSNEPFAGPKNGDFLGGAQVFRIFIRDQRDEKKFDALRRSSYFLHVFDEMLHKSKWDMDFLVMSRAVERVKNLLDANDLEYKILIEDVGEKIQAENIIPKQQELASLSGYKLTFDHYHRLEDQHGYLDYLNETYNDFVSVEDIGISHEGRKLKMIKVSSGFPNATAVWIDGGTHAREWIASATVLYITRELTEHRDNLPEEMKKLDYYILPMANPDGYEFTHSGGWRRMWRKNRSPAFLGCPGVDLNRNFGYKWGGKGSSSMKCRDIYRGYGPNSEPETTAVVNYIRRKSPKIQGFLTFHSYGQYILYPWGYDKKLTPDHQELQRVGDTAARRIKQSQGVVYKVGNSADMMYNAAGTSDDWAKSQNIKYAYTVELRDEGQNGFNLPASQIRACGKDGFEVLKAVAEALVQYPPYVS